MRTIGVSRWTALGLAFLATAWLTACSTSPASGGAGPSNGQTTTPAAAVSPAGTVSPAATGNPASSATPGASGSVQNLVVSTAVRSELAAAYVADRGIPLSDLDGAGPMPGSVYYAHDPATDTYWALADFEPSSTAPASVQVSFQDGTGEGLFKKVATGPWHVLITMNPVLCGELRFFPSAVLAAWALPTAPPAGGPC